MEASLSGSSSPVKALEAQPAAVVCLPVKNMTGKGDHQTGGNITDKVHLKNIFLMCLLILPAYTEKYIILDSLN